MCKHFSILPGMIIFFVVFSMTQGCSPVISQGILQQVDKSIRFADLQRNPEAFIGRMVLVGGRIIETKNFPSTTRIIVLAQNLDSRNRPVDRNESIGRFILSHPGFLDPAIYHAGRELTTAGEVAGKETMPLDDTHYTYPVIEQRELHIWPIDRPSGSPVRFGLGVGVGF